MEPADAFVQSKDVLTVAIRGHQVADELLNLAISESLHDPHALEVKRLSFSLKLDLAVALGCTDERDTLARLNAIRNRLAHQRTAAFDEKDAADLRSTWSGPMRFAMSEINDSGADTTTPLGVLRMTLLTVVVMLDGAIAQRQDDRAVERIFIEALADLARGRLGGPGVIDERIAAERERRRLERGR